MQVVLKAELLDLGICCGIKLCALTAVAHVDIVNILHQLYGFFLSDVFKKSTAELVCDIVLSIGKSTGSAETVHYGTGLAAYAAFYLHSVYGTFPFFKGISRFKNRYLKIGIQLH